MDTFDGSFLVAWIASALVSAVLLYFIIRLAVKHGIQDTRKPGWERPPDSLPPR
jgi:hypothetical protein